MAVKWNDAEMHAKWSPNEVAEVQRGNWKGRWEGKQGEEEFGEGESGLKRLTVEELIRMIKWN